MARQAAKTNPPYSYLNVIRRGEREYTYFRHPKLAQAIPLPSQNDEDFSAQYNRALEKVLTGPGEARHVNREGIQKLLKKTLDRCRRRATALGMEFDLDYDFIMELVRRQRYKCKVSGIQFCANLAEGARSNPFRPSIDRIDSSGGYTMDNVRLVLVGVNLGMADYTDQQYFEICRAVAQKNKR